MFYKTKTRGRIKQSNMLQQKTKIKISPTNTTTYSTLKNYLLDNQREENKNSTQAKTKRSNNSKENSIPM